MGLVWELRCSIFAVTTSLWTLSLQLLVWGKGAELDSLLSFTPKMYWKQNYRDYFYIVSMEEKPFKTKY